MKFVLALALVALTGCSKAENSNDEAAPVTEDEPVDQPADEKVADEKSDETGFPTLYIAAGEELPECNGNAVTPPKNQSQLIYVMDGGTFMVCASTGWMEVDLKGEDGKDGKDGDEGEAGTRIVAVQNLASNGADLCTRWSNITCNFATGAVVRYSNGLLSFSGRVHYTYTFDDAGDFDSDKDTVTSVPIHCLPEAEECSNPLTPIARTGSDDDKMLWLRYYRPSDSFRLVFDLDGDGEFTASDEPGIEILTVTSALVP